MNGVTPAGNWTGLFAPGERVRLRFINGSAMSIFDVRIPGLEMTVVAADGQYVEPVAVEEFRLSAAETLDVLVEPQGEEAYTVFAQSMDRAGFARGTLAIRDGAQAAVPELDPVAYLSMADMGHADHGGDAVAAAPAAVDHSAHEPAPRLPPSTRSTPRRRRPRRIRPRPRRSRRARPAAPAATIEHAHAAGATPPTHPASESGNPGVDMQATAPSPRLDDPGVGLRDNGRRVLTYADLKSAFPRSRRASARAHDRAAFDGPHGALRMVVRRHSVLGFRAARAALRRARPHRARQRHDDGAPDPPARHVERPRERSGRIPSSQAHDLACRRARGARSA